MVLDYAARKRPARILEIGHGNRSPSLDILHARAECWGLDDHDKDRTVPVAALERFRKTYPGATFRAGYLGSGVDLPDSYFDLIYSVSVIEHLPTDQLAAFHGEAARILRPGGVQLHSYDVPLGFDLTTMHKAIEAAGFEWVDERCEPAGLWRSAEFQSALPHVVFEHAAHVLTRFNHAVPPEKRRLWNWLTIFVGARKPEPRPGAASPPAPRAPGDAADLGRSAAE